MRTGFLLHWQYQEQTPTTLKLVGDTLDVLQTDRPGRRLNICLDKGYEAVWSESELKERRYEPHIPSRKEESTASKNVNDKACRWVVERTHSWMNRCRRIRTRREKTPKNYETMLHFACGIIVWNKILVGQALASEIPGQQH